MSGVVDETLRAYRRFSDALLEFSEDPSPDNLERYLAASAAIESSRDVSDVRAAVDPAVLRPDDAASASLERG